MSEPLVHPATYIPAQPAVLVLGDRRMPIEEWPLARSVEERRAVEIKRPSDDRLVIEPAKRSGAAAVTKGTFVFLGGVLPGAIAHFLEVPWWGSALISLVVLALLILMVHGMLSQLRWVRFDRAAGDLVIEGRGGFLLREARVERRLPLKSILAVQLLYSGRHSVTEPQGAGERQTTSHREFFGYELNLILDDPRVPRLNLFSTSDWQWIREAGQAVGELLGIPVIDKLHHGG
jgi:hypothetical protein